MPTEFDSERCRRRNRLAALRMGIDAASFQFGAQAPRTDAGILAAINRLRGSNEPLAMDDIWVHHAEAANSNFISDRYMFLEESTLKNIATDAKGGVAFMNSHRTGGMSSDATLPMGKTFSGAYEALESGKNRCVVGLYMLRGKHPNGTSGPGTDDIHALIDGGVFNDVSVGLFGGESKCDVCGKDMGSWADEYCEHVPGTTRSMSMEEMKAQKKRGVPEGRCSYSLFDARMGEVSAVYEGAVPEAGFIELSARCAPVFNGSMPGTGFQKAVQFAKLGKLSDNTLEEARHSFGSVALSADFDGGAPATLPFTAQLDKTLAEVEGCIHRAESIQKMRQAEGRTLSEDRVSRLKGIGESIRKLTEVDDSREREARFREIQERALRLR